MTAIATTHNDEITDTVGGGASIVISTTPPAGPRRSLAGVSAGRSPLVGLVARIIAGVTGALLGLAIGLASAGFDTTRILLAVGAFALGVGWFIALVTGLTTSRTSSRTSSSTIRPRC